MKLLTLTLDNFKGIKHFELNTNGHSVNVYGSNGTGKTTLMDAFTWLLFGKNSKDEKDFGIKTREDGVEIPKIDHTVSALVEHNGKQIFLQKVYKEKWRKARGASEATYDGNTTSYFYGSADAPTPVTAAAKINDMLEKAFWAGLRYKDPHRVLYEAPSVFDDDNDEDEAPLIDVPDGSDNPDYGPEKIPPRPVHKLTVDELPKHKPDI